MSPDFTKVMVVDLPSGGTSSGLVAKMFVLGETPLPFAQYFTARFDDLAVVAVNVDPRGTGFSGYLTERPAEGAHLIVEFEGEEPFDTGLVYREYEPPIA